MRSLRKHTSISPLAHLELGEFEAAINHANAALRIDPNYEPARMLIEFIAD